MKSSEAFELFRRKLYLLLFSILFSLATVACGGGGGGGSGGGGDPSIDPGLEVSRTAVDFATIQGGALPGRQVVQTTVSAGDAFYILVGFPPEVTEQPAWLDLDLYGGGTQWTIGLNITTSSLTPGEYTTTLRVLCARQDQSVIAYRDFAVRYTIRHQLDATPQNLLFSYNEDAPSPPADQLARIDGPGLEWTATADRDWVDLSSANGTAPSDLGIGVDPSALAPGVHQAVVTVTSGLDNIDINVRLEIAAVAFETGTGTLLFSQTNGGPADSQMIDIRLNNGADIAWTATTSDPWLVIDKVQGSTPDTVAVTIDAATPDLASGNYAGYVALSGSYNGQTLTATVPVQLELTAPSFTVSPGGGIVLGGSRGLDLQPQAQLSFGLTTGSVTLYPWTATLTTDSGISWLSADIVSGNVSGTAVQMLLSADRSLLTGGVYQATVTIQTDVNGDHVVETVPVTLNVEARRLFATDNGLALASMPNLSRLSHSVTVEENYGTADIPWSAVSDQPWLSVTASGLTGDALTVTADPTGLSTDTLHYAAVTISTTESTIENGDETMRVGFWVGSTDPSATTRIDAAYSELTADPIRPFVYVHDGGTDISIYNVYTGALVNTVPDLGTELSDMTVSNDGSMLWAVADAGLRIASVDLDTQSADFAWHVGMAGRNPRLVFARPHGFPVLIANTGAAYDTATGQWLGLYDDRGVGNLAVSADGTRLIEQSYPLYEDVYIYRHDIRPTALGVYALDMQLIEFTFEAGLGIDLTVSHAGEKIYSAIETLLHFNVYDALTLEKAGTLPADAAPNNAEVGSNGWFYGGISTLSGPVDVWVYDGDDNEIATYDLSGDGASILDRQLAVSGDGLRIIALTSDGAVQMVAGP